MAITWKDLIAGDPTDITEVSKVYLGYSYGETGVRTSLPVAHLGDAWAAKAEALADLVEPYTFANIRSISILVQTNLNPSDVDDPGAEARGVTLKFKHRVVGGALAEQDLTLFVPVFKATSNTSIQDLGEAAALILSTGDDVTAGSHRVRFVGRGGNGLP